jgi:hypothetical protein
MALIELLIILFTIMLFIISDSKTINILAQDILNRYHINYKDISGNIFTGIKIIDLEYNSTKIVDKIDIKWNPVSLINNRINITKFELKNINSPKLLEIINTLPKSKNKKNNNIFFNYKVKNIKITATPFKYKNITFKNIELDSDSFSINKNMQNIQTENTKFSIDTSLGNIGLHGNFYNKRVHINRMSIVNIDLKEITKIIKSLPKKSNKKKTPTKKKNNIFITTIKIDKLLSSLKRTTYKPITLEETQLTLSSIKINLQKSFNISSKKAILKAKTTFGDTKQIGYIKNSQLYTTGNIILRDYLFKRYKLPLNKKELKKLPIKLKLTQKGLWIETKNSNIKKLLTLKTNFNIDIKEATHKFSYTFKKKKIYIYSKAKASITYANSCTINNTLLIDIAKKGYTTYQGDIKIDKPKLPTKAISTKKLLKNLQATYKGDKKGLLVNFQSNTLKGEFITKGYKNAKINLYTKKPIYLDSIFSTPPDSLHFLANIKSSSFIDFKNSKNNKIKLSIKSNKININSYMKMVKPLRIKFDITIPKNSQLLQNNKLKISALSKIDGWVLIKKDIVSLYLSNRDIKIESDFNFKKNYINRGVIYIGNEKIKFGGNIKKDIKLSTKINNLSKLSQIVMKYYNINLKDLKGDADIFLRYKPNSKTTNILIKSQNIIYKTLQGDIWAKIHIDKKLKTDIVIKSKKLNLNNTSKTPILLHSIFAKLSIWKNQIRIYKYDFKFYNKYISHFYSNKTSFINFSKNRLLIKKLWLKDNILINGNFDTKKLYGNFNIVGKHFKFRNSDFNLLSDFNLDLEVNKNKLFISGLVELLGKTITYKSIGVSQDSDIIILQNQSKKQKNILDNIKLNIQVKNEIPLHYKTDNIDIYFTNDITVIKDYFKEIKVLGTTTIEKGYYQQDNKKFYFDKSYIYFSGNPKKPMLDIKAIYNKEQYSIQIFITGTPDDPIINFNSDPYLTQKQILSLILFDSTGENSGSGNELYSLLGGTFAKELMKSLGINIDHLVLGQGIDDQISLEVGQKISKDITVIYLHNNGKDGVKVKVDHGRHFETDILIYPQSSSIDFLYKSD